MNVEGSSSSSSAAASSGSAAGPPAGYSTGSYIVLYTSDGQPIWFDPKTVSGVPEGQEDLYFPLPYNASVASSSTSLYERPKMPDRTANIAYFVFGRFQPPHTGHIEHIMAMIGLAVSNATASNPIDVYIFPSPTDGTSDDPLIMDIKLHVITELLKKKLPGGNPPNVNIHIINTLEIPNVGSPFAAIVALLRKGYTQIRLFGSGDRVESFAKMIAPFKAKGTDIESLDTVRRMNESGEAVGISGSKLREIAIRTPFKRADFEEFKGKGYTIDSKVQLSDMGIIDIIRNIRISSGVPDIADESGKVIFTEGGRRSTRKR
jgi:hypothetical protein